MFVSAPGALSHLTEISLHYAQLTGTSFSRLLLSCGSQLSTLEVTSCRRLPIRDFISAVLDNAPNLEVLRTVKCFSEDVPPIQHDYLSRLPKLTELRLSGNSLAPSGLCYLGPLVWSVTLQDCSLSAYEIASSVLCIDEDRSESKTCITFYLTSSEYDDEAQKMLRVCVTVIATTIHLFSFSVVFGSASMSTLSSMRCQPISSSLCFLLSATSVQRLFQSYVHFYVLRLSM